MGFVRSFASMGQLLRDADWDWKQVKLDLMSNDGQYDRKNAWLSFHVAMKAVLVSLILIRMNLYCRGGT